MKLTADGKLPVSEPNNSTASSLLRQDYKDDIGLDDALGLAVKVLSKTMDSTTLDSEKGKSPP